MIVQLQNLVVRTRQTTERIEFSDVATFLHGPVGTGKSSVARLVDYCLGGRLERTPAIQQEVLAAELSLRLGVNDCRVERSVDDLSSVRVSWTDAEGKTGSVNAPLKAGEAPIHEEDVFNLSDLVFHLCGVSPIKVRKSRRDPDSAVIRLSFRDVWRFCYLDQTHLDSSFFRLEDPFRGRKSQDALRFFTGLHSEALSRIEEKLSSLLDDQRSKREAIVQIRHFMKRFELGSEIEVEEQIQTVREGLATARSRMAELQRTRAAQTHPTDDLRMVLVGLGERIESLKIAHRDSSGSIEELEALKAELITAKVKSERANRAGEVLTGVDFARCPRCGTDVSERIEEEGQCRLCCSQVEDSRDPVEPEAFRRDLNERIDEISDSIRRRTNESARTRRSLRKLTAEKEARDLELQEELQNYDSAFVESMRGVEREVATLVERLSSLKRLKEMPQAVDELEERAGAIQGEIDRLRSAASSERERLKQADANIRAVADGFASTMLKVGFPGVEAGDEVLLDPRNWRPLVAHGGQEWGFWDTGSGGKKTLFNVCFALALHEVARELDFPVPSVLVIDSPTKNISEDENEALVRSLYAEIYRLASAATSPQIQLLLIDSDLVVPGEEMPTFLERRMAGEDDSPSLIPYYEGP